MATLTLHLEVDNDEYQDILAFEKQNKIPIGEILKDYLKTKIYSEEFNSENLEIAKIRALRGKYAKYTKKIEPISVEEMNDKMLEAFAKDWKEREAFNMSNKI